MMCYLSSMTISFVSVLFPFPYSFMISRSYYEGKEMTNKKSNQAGLTTEVKPAIEFLYPALLFATSACIRVAIFRVNLIPERGLLNGV